MKVSTKSQYGLRAIIYLARAKQKVCSLKSISKAEDISFDYLEKIISKLERNGLVKSKRGIRGGYFLARKPSTIRLGEVIRALEGGLSLVKCISKKGRYVCKRERRCLARIFWKKVQESLDSALDSVTLADLISNKKH